jgi:hypothetical protein
MRYEKDNTRKKIVPALILLIICGCSMETGQDDERMDLQEAIIGKWLRVSHGVSEDELIEHSFRNGEFIEYFSDGSYKFFCPTLVGDTKWGGLRNLQNRF